jgi:hypothetical protein
MTGLLKDANFSEKRIKDIMA